MSVCHLDTVRHLWMLLTGAPSNTVGGYVANMAPVFLAGGLSYHWKHSTAKWKCMYCMTVGPDALITDKRTSDMKRIQRQMIASRPLFLEGDKGDSCWEAVCFSVAVIETGACLMCWLCYEFEDSMMEISGLHYDLHNQKKTLTPPKKSPGRQLWACVGADRRSLQGQMIAKN